jgi:ParB/RepB/Spo0J family partition protein
MQIPTNAILPNPQQPRLVFAQDVLLELADSMRVNGQIHAVVVEEGPVVDGEEAYTLIDGERRWRAAKLLGWSTIEATIRPSANGSGSVERAVLALVANLQRADLNPIEEARSYKGLSALGLSNVAIAYRVGKSVSRVAHRISLLDLPEEIQDLVAANMFPLDKRAADALNSVPAGHRVELARKLARPGLGIKPVQVAARRLNDALSAGRVKDDPALHFAYKRAGKPNLPDWDALHQLGRLPPWPGVVQAAHDTCASCELRAEACAVICERCPAVVLLAGMIRIAAEDGR